jgi:lactoylglutathione lyase
MITHIGHSAFLVSDLERSLHFYCNVLGLQEAFQLKRPDGKPWLVYIRVDEHSFVELFPGRPADAPPLDPKSSYRHLCLLVDDIQETVKMLGARGLPVPGEPKLGGDGNWQYWIKDPDGNDIELMQIMPDSLQARSRKHCSS